jgi:hypothetical protein
MADVKGSDPGILSLQDGVAGIRSNVGDVEVRMGKDIINITFEKLVINIPLRIEDQRTCPHVCIGKEPATISKLPNKKRQPPEHS